MKYELHMIHNKLSEMEKDWLPLMKRLGEGWKIVNVQNEVSGIATVYLISKA